MLARVFDTAKRILSRSPSVQARSSEVRDISPAKVPQDDGMVTTRGGTRTPGVTEATPRSSAKKRAYKREIESLETPTQAKRQKKSGPTPEKKFVSETPDPEEPAESVEQESIEDGPDNSHVVIPSSSIPENDEIPRRKRPIIAIVKSNPVSPAGVEQDEDSKKAIEEDEDEIAVSPEPDTATSSQTKKAHKRFGSEEPTDSQANQYEVSEEPQEAAIESIEDNEADSNASDSDEAPDIVASAAAASQVKVAKQEANRAQQAQTAAEEAKRHKREARIAEEQAQKRAREETKAKKLARQLAKQQSSTTEHESKDHSSTPQTKDSLPALLPASLLNAIDPHRPATPPPQQADQTQKQRKKEKLQHHINFLERSEKPIKDVKKGRLSVAVLASQNRVLAPTGNRASTNVREHWLKGRRGEGKMVGGGGKRAYRLGRVERRPFGRRGFVRGGD